MVNPSSLSDVGPGILAHHDRTRGPPNSPRAADCRRRKSSSKWPKRAARPCWMWGACRQQVGREFDMIRPTATLALAAAVTLAMLSAALAETAPCRPISYQRNAYTVCDVDLRRH